MLNVMASESLIVQIYKLCMGICISVAVVTALIVLSNYLSLEEGMGNAGGFLAGLSMAAVLIAVVIVTPVASIAAGVSFVFQDKLPATKYYSYWLPLSFTTPAVAALVFMAGPYVQNI
jgi:hypothetical protein